MTFAIQVLRADLMQRYRARFLFEENRTRYREVIRYNHLERARGSRVISLPFKAVFSANDLPSDCSIVRHRQQKETLKGQVIYLLVTFSIVDLSSQKKRAFLNIKNNTLIFYN